MAPTVLGVSRWEFVCVPTTELYINRLINAAI